MEILSPGSHTRDLRDKLLDYQHVGIPHYWAFDPEVRAFHEFALDEATREYRQLTHTGGRIKPQAFVTQKPALTLDLNRLWPDLD